ncbi:hypothetical protein K443DRAFT_677989 [Laccaria amethystina LaAM-08-1]|uniref:Uncharacterized protein n=1 Tax=Laccaria amethystina LaAM-08-1 TaxID=1095629 RepID=A0A0C9XKI9_9AGAR|nr:hypothetical protein K443DRAFT_677989 [Laccaria amethystina LaAM-08-1]
MMNQLQVREFKTSARTQPVKDPTSAPGKSPSRLKLFHLRSIAIRSPHCSRVGFYRNGKRIYPHRTPDCVHKVKVICAFSSITL